jgi:biotin synthase
MKANLNHSRSNSRSRDDVAALFRTPLLDLVFEAATVHRRFHDAHEVQRCTLLSVKTGGCPEDCSYCPQSVHYNSGVEETPLLPLGTVLEAARDARDRGATRFCMGAAWREVQPGPEFDRVVDMVRGVSALGIEVCCTLGMLTKEQAQRLKDAGLTAYNHNLDTSEEHYSQIIKTRSYEDRLATLEAVRDAGLHVCTGGIVGLGEREDDIVDLLYTLSSMDPHPESVPVNGLVRAEGTPLEHATPFDPLRLVRTVATARILMPRTRVRLAAGRTDLTPEAQALAFLAGANSIFYGDRLLTTPNPACDADELLLKKLGLAVEGAAEAPASS